MGSSPARRRVSACLLLACLVGGGGPATGAAPAADAVRMKSRRSMVQLLVSERTLIERKATRSP